MENPLIMKTYKLLCSSRFIETTVGNLLLGVPSDILKKIGATKTLGVPTILVQPDVNHFEGIPQFAPEFPLYYFLFIGRYLFKKRFIFLVKDEAHKQKEIEILTHMLPGPDFRYLLKNGVEERVADGLRREMDYMALKDRGKVLEVTEMIEFITPDEDNGYTIKGDNNGLLRVNRLGNNKFELIEDNSHKTTIELKNQSELPIKINYQLASSYIPPVFGLVNLGSRSGFDSDSYTTTMVLSINGVMGLLDGSAYIMHQLNHFGLSFDDIKFIFLTHTHDDHCNLTPVVYKTARRIPIVTTKDIYESAVIKVTSILEEISAEDFRKQFPLIEIKAGYDKDCEPINFYGATIYAHRTIHSIPCVGFTIEIEGETLFFSGDTLSPEKVEDFHKNGAITKERADYLIGKLNGNYTRALIDGGGGLIHGDPEEFKPKRGLHIVHVNPKSLDNTLHNLLDAGQSLLIIPSQNINQNIAYEIIKILKSIGISVYDPWMKVFLNAGKLVYSQQYEFLALEGELDESGIFIVLSGEVEVLTGMNRVASFRQGSFFGELALLEEEKTLRKAAIRISSITALLWEIPADIFQSYIKSTDNKEYFYNMRNSIIKIENMPQMRGLSEESITTLAGKSNMIIVNENEYVFKNRPLKQIIFLLSGEVQLIKNNEVSDTIRIDDIKDSINITSILDNDAELKMLTKTKTDFLLINKKAYEKILEAHAGYGSSLRHVE